MCTKLAIPEDKEEMALTLNGEKRKLKRADFGHLATSLKIPQKTVENSYAGLQKKLEGAMAFIDISFLTEGRKNQYKEILLNAATVLELALHQS